MTDLGLNSDPTAYQLHSLTLLSVCVSPINANTLPCWAVCNDQKISHVKLLAWCLTHSKWLILNRYYYNIILLTLPSWKFSASGIVRGQGPRHEPVQLPSCLSPHPSFLLSLYLPSLRSLSKCSSSLAESPLLSPSQTTLCTSS